MTGHAGPLGGLQERKQSCPIGIGIEPLIIRFGRQDDWHPLVDGRYKLVRRACYDGAGFDVSIVRSFRRLYVGIARGFAVA